MSHKKTPTACVVIDASIARAAGPLESEDARAVRCREFLMTFRAVGHRIAFNAAIKSEWDKHMSGFAATWLVSIVSIGNVQPVPADLLEQFREAIDEHCPDAGVKKAVIKDAHLVEAAMSSDKRVAALDDKVRGHLARLAVNFTKIQPLLWVNPDHVDEDVIAWLEAGALNESGRQLGRYRPDGE